MLPMLQKHALITATLIATLGLSACGKKTEVFGGSKPPDSSGASDSSNQSNDKNDRKDCIETGESDNSSSTGRNNAGDVLTDLPDPTASGNTCYTPPPKSDIPPVGPVGSGSGEPVLPPVADTELMPVASAPISADYNPKDSKNVYTDQNGKR
ncbi:MAG: hypothetical protein ACM3MG_00715, partial [Bacillota bacterium]